MLQLDFGTHFWLYFDFKKTQINRLKEMPSKLDYKHSSLMDNILQRYLHSSTIHLIQQQLLHQRHMDSNINLIHIRFLILALVLLLLILPLIKPIIIFSLVSQVDILVLQVLLIYLSMGRYILTDHMG